MNADECLTTAYDEGSDVMYITRGNAAAHRGVEDQNGIVWRYGVNGELVGATVLDFRGVWGNRRAEIAKEISARFGVPQAMLGQAVSEALTHAAI